MDATSNTSHVPAAEYRLFVREGMPRFYFKNDDEGIYLSPKGVGWFLAGRAYTRDWSDIAAVNLFVAYIPKNGSTGTCVLTFRDGSKITILSASKWGHSDEERNAEYGRFLTDFHRSIPPQLRGAVVFSSGVSQARHSAMAIVFAIAALFFVGLPLGLAVYLWNVEALLIAGAGAAFVWPVYRMTEAAAPANYDPLNVPQDFFP